jgi:hypothetical protein
MPHLRHGSIRLQPLSRTQGTNFRTDTVTTTLQHHLAFSLASEYDEGGLGVRRCCGA